MLIRGHALCVLLTGVMALLTSLPSYASTATLTITGHVLASDELNYPYSIICGFGGTPCPNMPVYITLTYDLATRPNGAPNACGGSFSPINTTGQLTIGGYTLLVSPNFEEGPAASISVTIGYFPQDCIVSLFVYPLISAPDGPPAGTFLVYLEADGDSGAHPQFSSSVTSPPTTIPPPAPFSQSGTIASIR